MKIAIFPDYSILADKAIDVRVDDINHINQGIYESLQAIGNALACGNNAVILSGVQVINTPVSGGLQYTWASGFVFWDGEIFTLASGTQLVTSGNTLVLKMVETLPAGEPHTATDGVTSINVNVTFIRTVEFAEDAPGGGSTTNYICDYADLKPILTPAWQTLTAINDWDSVYLQYKRLGNEVTIRGFLLITTGPVSQICANLPADIIPTNNLLFTSVANIQTGVYQQGIIGVNNDGDLVIQRIYDQNSPGNTINYYECVFEFQYNID